MITAVPVSQDRIAGHFTKADSFIFINAEGRIVCHHYNPAKEEGCAGKNHLLSLFNRQKVSRVIARNIGERMLGKLLALNVDVFQVNGSQLDIASLSAAASDGMTPLVEASQGRRSSNYHDKKASGGCGCHSEGHEEGHECSHEKGHCCRGGAQHKCCGH
jgi:predicted Fe-Mo cluster-binding NifX family protein